MQTSTACDFFRKYEPFLGCTMSNFSRQRFLKTGEGSGRSGLRNADLEGVGEDLSQSVDSVIAERRAPRERERRADLFENPRKWHVSPVVRRLAILCTAASDVSLSRAV